MPIGGRPIGGNPIGGGMPMNGPIMPMGPIVAGIPNGGTMCPIGPTGPIKGGTPIMGPPIGAGSGGRPASPCEYLQRSPRRQSPRLKSPHISLPNLSYVARGPPGPTGRSPSPMLGPGWGPTSGRAAMAGLKSWENRHAAPRLHSPRVKSLQYSLPPRLRLRGRPRGGEPRARLRLRLRLRRRPPLRSRKRSRLVGPSRRAAGTTGGSFFRVRHCALIVKPSRVTSPRSIAWRHSCAAEQSRKRTQGVSSLGSPILWQMSISP
mmetsp:Transcript_15148/g.41873  ORF Transcript_15148/g.41873 Transcript_15148/m.41873 type:complete len:263 (-) Transcript_15148:179-967(-)